MSDYYQGGIRVVITWVVLIFPVLVDLYSEMADNTSGGLWIQHVGISGYGQ